MATPKKLSLAKLKANRKKWIAALRSGKYEQGTGFLEASGKFCCLGVLCAVAGIEKTGTGDIVMYHEHVSIAPVAAQNWVGLNHPTGEFIPINIPKDLLLPETTGITDLALLNDHGKTFEQIATILELEPEGLFNND